MVSSGGSMFDVIEELHKRKYIEPISFASERYDLYGACSFKTSEKYKEQTADVENKIIKFTPQN